MSHEINQINLFPPKSAISVEKNSESQPQTPSFGGVFGLIGMLSQSNTPRTGGSTPRVNNSNEISGPSPKVSTLNVLSIRRSKSNELQDKVFITRSPREDTLATFNSESKPATNLDFAGKSPRLEDSISKLDVNNKPTSLKHLRKVSGDSVNLTAHLIGLQQQQNHMRKNSIASKIEVVEPATASSTSGKFEHRVIGGKYLIGVLLGSGSFGEVYSGVNVQNAENIAIKMETTSENQLVVEYNIYKILAGLPGFPIAYYFGAAKFGQDLDRRVMVLQKLGPSLADLRDLCGGKFTLRTVLLLSIQLLIRIECVHKCGFLHRDLKPENFLIGTNNDLIYLIDFGLSKRYCNSEGEHVPNSQHKKHRGLTGTTRYASLHAHLGVDPSRRDDLESLGYVLLYFLLGRLPWQGLKFAEQESAAAMQLKVHQIKEHSIKTGALFKDLPEEFEQYFKYCRSLAYDEEPDYSKLRRLFRDVYKRYNYDCDKDGIPVIVFDWNERKSESKSVLLPPGPSLKVLLSGQGSSGRHAYKFSDLIPTSIGQDSLADKKVEAMKQDDVESGKKLAEFTLNLSEKQINSNPDDKPNNCSKSTADAFFNVRIDDSEPKKQVKHFPNPLLNFSPHVPSSNTDS